MANSAFPPKLFQKVTTVTVGTDWQRGFFQNSVRSLQVWDQEMPCEMLCSILLNKTLFHLLILFFQAAIKQLSIMCFVFYFIFFSLWKGVSGKEEHWTWRGPAVCYEGKMKTHDVNHLWFVLVFIKNVVKYYYTLNVPAFCHVTITILSVFYWDFCNKQ